MVKVVGLGTCSLDLSFKVLKTAIEGVSLASSFIASAGGVVGNALSGLARLGVSVGFVGKLGDDKWARQLLAAFLRDGVDFSKVVFSEGGKTEVVSVTVDEYGERCFVVFLGSILELMPEEVDLKYVKSASIFLTDGIPLETALYVANEVKKAGVKVFFTPAAPPNLYEAFLRGSKQNFMKLMLLSDVFSTSFHIASAITNCSSDEEAVRSLHDLIPQASIAITTGSKGCTTYYNSTIEQVGAFKVDVVDTTGAGDAFNVGLLYGLLKGLDFRTSALLGNAIAAIKCTRFGARDGLPNLSQLRDFLSSRGFRDLASMV